MISHIILAFGFPLLCSALLTPAVRRFATNIGAIDVPDERKIHTRPIPRLGGLAPFAGFAFGTALFVFADPQQAAGSWVVSAKGATLFCCLAAITALGVWDDINSLKPGVKFLVQLAAAVACYQAGFRISTITNPFDTGFIRLGTLDFPVTVAWIVGVTNAFNLIDGIDGLACGIGAIASLTIFFITLLNGDAATAFPAFILAGSLVGFLFFNFNPARIFLGDSGSLFMGLALSVLSIAGSTKGSAAVALSVPLLILGVPIADTLLSIVRRLLRSFLPGQRISGPLMQRLHGIFLPDRRHIHHQLLALGFSQRKTALVLYAISCCLGAGAIAVTRVGHAASQYILLAAAAAAFAGIRFLRYREMAIFRNGMLLPLYEWPMIHRTVVQSLLDVGFIAAAFRIALFIDGGTDPLPGHGVALWLFLPFVCAIQLAGLHFMGLYRAALRYLGIGDILNIISSVALAILWTVLASLLVPELAPLFSVRFAIVDFYILLSFIAGSRASFHALNYLFRTDAASGRRILLYGANAEGIMTLQRILNAEGKHEQIVGFLDDNPGLEGKRVNGYEVFGGHWNLERLLSAQRIDEIRISGAPVHPLVLERIRSLAFPRGIVLTRSRVLLEEVSPRPAGHSGNPVPAIALVGGHPGNGGRRSGEIHAVAQMEQSAAPNFRRGMR